MYNIYVTANLRNQIFPGIANPFRESGESLKCIEVPGISEIDFQLFQVRLGWEYLVAQIRCNIYIYIYICDIEKRGRWLQIVIVIKG